MQQSWPPDELVDALVKRASGLFIYAATACEYVDGNGHGSIINRLQWITDSARKLTNLQVSTIDNLYRDILDSAFSNLESEEAEKVRKILLVVLVVSRPLEATTIASLLHIHDTSEVYQCLAAFHSVIRVPTPGDGPITIFHASFPDFISNEARAGTYFLSISNANLFLAQHCLIALDALHENMCDVDIVVKGRPANEDIAADLISSKIPEALAYVAQNFMRHCCHSKSFSEMPEDIRLHLQTFLQSRSLPWIEVLSLKGWLFEGIAAMRKLGNWVPSVSLCMFVLYVPA